MASSSGSYGSPTEPQHDDLRSAVLRLKSSLLLLPPAAGDGHDALLAAADDLCSLSSRAHEEQVAAQHLAADMALLRQELQRQVDLNDLHRREQYAERDRLRAVGKAEADVLNERLQVALAGKADAVATGKAQAEAAAALLARTRAEHAAESERLEAARAAERARSIAALERSNAIAAARLDAATASAAASGAILTAELSGSEAREERLRDECVRLTRSAEERIQALMLAIGQRDDSLRALTAEVERLRGLCAAVGRPDASASAWRALHLESLKVPPSPPRKEEAAPPQPRASPPSPPAAPAAPAGCVTYYDLTPRLAPQVHGDPLLSRGGLERQASPFKPLSAGAPPSPRAMRLGAAAAATQSRGPARATAGGGTGSAGSAGGGVLSSSTGRDSWTRLARPWHAGRWEGWPSSRMAAA